MTIECRKNINLQTTNRDREVLADEVKRAKNLTVSKEQFSDIDSNAVDCRIELYDLIQQKLVTLKGKVFNLNQSPYKVEFKYPKDAYFSKKKSKQSQFILSLKAQS